MDTDAIVYEDADLFFKSNQGGGTDNIAGYKNGLEVQKEFPRGQWDRYVVSMGDLEDLSSFQRDHFSSERVLTATIE